MQWSEPTSEFQSCSHRCVCSVFSPLLQRNLPHPLLTHALPCPSVCLPLQVSMREEEVTVLRNKAAAAADRATAASDDMPAPSGGNEQQVRRGKSRVMGEANGKGYHSG